jgi:glycosyltransferase involved in cell wall biosynthesis
VSHEVVVEQPDDADEWATRLLALLDDEGRRAYQGAEARRRASALLSPSASLATIERFLGWLAWERSS